MPNRIIRDWTDSKTINSLTWQEEVLFTRLIMKADDYGNFYADSSVIKSLCFPRKDGLRTTDIDGWLTKLETARLILRYPAKGDTFLHIRNFGQRLDRAKRKFPQEPSEKADNDSVVIDNEPPPETKRNESESRNETSVNAHAGENNGFDFSLPPSQEMCEEFFFRAGSTREEGAEFFRTYNSTDWRDRNGNKVMNWGDKAKSWIYRNSKTHQNGKSKRYEPAKHNDDFGNL